MFTKMFGNYLLSKNLLTVDQLKIVLNKSRATRTKLGVLAINEGYMNAQQVTEIHEKQRQVDKKFGELAIEHGYLTEDQFMKLNESQNIELNTLGQAVIDHEYMTLLEYENEIKNYLDEFQITEQSFKNLQKGCIEEEVNLVCTFDDYPQHDLYRIYISLFSNILGRFIEKDFYLEFSSEIKEYNFQNLVSQNIHGEYPLHLAISASDDVFIKFASIFSEEEIMENDEFTKATVSEFLNLANGLFIMNLSNLGIDLDLLPQAEHNKGSLSQLNDCHLLPIELTFGRIDLILSENPIQIS